MENEPKIIGAAKFRSTLTNGIPTKHYVQIYDNGVTQHQMVVFTDNKQLIEDGWEIFSTRFGKNVLIKRTGLKFSTLSTLYKIATELIIKTTIKIEDIL